MSGRRNGVRDRRAGDTSTGRRWPMLVALIIMWIALWGALSIANILGGAAVAVAVLAFAGRVKPRPVRNVHPAAALRALTATIRRHL